MSPRSKPRDRLGEASPEMRSAALAIEVAPIPRSARTIIWLIIAGLSAGMAWAAWAEIDEIVVAPGKLTTIEQPIVIQPLETATIRRLDGQVGETVKRGQLLVELDLSFAGADVTSSRIEQESLDAQIARLRAELAGRTTVLEVPAVSPERLRVEQDLLSDRLRENAARLNVFTAREQKARAEIAAIEKLVPIASKRREMYAELLTSREALYGTGNVRHRDVLEVAVQLQSTEQELVQQAVRIESLHEELKGVAAEREAYIKERRRQAAEQLSEVERQRAKATGGLEKSVRRAELVALRAPDDGVIFERAKLNVGSVAQSGNPLLVLVPLGATLEADVEIPTRDIGSVRIGALVSVKLEAFPFQVFDTLAGRVKSVAPDVTVKPASEGGGAAFKAKIALNDQRLAKMPVGSNLSAGITVTAEIKAKKRTVLSYLLYPIVRWLSEGGRELSL